MSVASPAAVADFKVAPMRMLVAFNDGMSITTFDPAHRDEFRRLNLQWLTRYFVIEPIDERVMTNPELEILAPGGEILFATLDDAVAGTVALKAEPDGSFELSKMAVDDLYKGRGYGKRLLEAACALAKHRGAAHVVLYSRRILQTAVSMYFKYGFVEVPLGDDLRYTRCDIKMMRRL